MNYKEQFDQIVEFLKCFEYIWQNEILDIYPRQLEYFNSSWIKQLSKLTEEDLFKVDCLGDETLVGGDFKSYLSKIKNLTKTSKATIGKTSTYPDWAFHKVKGKKRYEIERLVKVLKDIKDEIKFEKLVDIGGGVGHFARVAAHYEGIPVTSLDINSDFQEIGQNRLKKYPLPDGAKDVEFINHDFSKSLSGEVNKRVFNENSFSLGLHTCGPLAVEHIKVATKNKTKGFLNFGCCYNKLNPETDTNLSAHAKKSGLKITQYSTTLAARGHRSMNFEDFLTKKKVKMFRYALHFLLEDLGRSDIISVGDCHVRVYQGNFCDYALNRLKFKEVEHSYTPEQLDKYFEDKTDILNELFFANIIRWQLGRVLELYILLDRVIYLEENGFRPSLLEYFSEEISPRNLGLLVK